MKRILGKRALALLVVLVLLAQPVALAIPASNVFDAYGAGMFNVSTGKIKCVTEVDAVAYMSVLGVENIELQRYVNSKWTYVIDSSAIYKYDALDQMVMFTYSNLVMGGLYRCIVGFYGCRYDGDYDRRQFTTATIVCT